MKSRRYKNLKSDDVISFGFDVNTGYDPNDQKAFIYLLRCENVECIELSDSDDDEQMECTHSDSETMPPHQSFECSRSDNSTTNSLLGKCEVLIRVDTQPMVVNPFAVMKKKKSTNQQNIE